VSRADTAAGVAACLTPSPAPCPHRKIVPVDANWGRCPACGDDSFPLSAWAAGTHVEDDPAELAERQRVADAFALLDDLAESLERTGVGRDVDPALMARLRAAVRP
jgi:hypothetical protein